MLAVSAIEAQEELRPIDFRLPAVLTITVPYFTLELLPNIIAGSAVQAIGIHATTYITLPELPVLENIYFYTQGAYFYSFNNLGFPGASHTGYLSAAIGVSVGEVGTLRNNFIPLGNRRHTIFYQYEYFIDSQNTSQALGLFGYYYSEPTWMVGLFSENDSTAFVAADKFRTAAVESAALFNTNGHVWGLGIGMRIWIGINGPEIITGSGLSNGGHRGGSFAISNQNGNSYAHGILHLTGYYDSFKLSIGWESEEIRDILQNGFHFFVNQAFIEPIPNISPRFYIQLEINPRFSLY